MNNRPKHVWFKIEETECCSLWLVRCAQCSKLKRSVDKYSFVARIQRGLNCTLSISRNYNARKVISEVYISFVLSLGGNVNTRRMSKPDMGSIFHIQKINEILCELSNYQNLMLLTSSETKRTLMHLFLFTNSAQRELVSICMQSIHNCN